LNTFHRCKTFKIWQAIIGRSFAPMSREEIQAHLSFSPVNKTTIGLQKILHREVFPVRYTDGVYEMMIDRKSTQADLAFLYDDTAVGEVSFRIEEQDGVKKAYLMTIGVLPAYQRLGIGTALLEHAIKEAQALGPIEEMYLHVLAENTGAIAFYERHGFVKGELQENYYSSLEKGDAYTLSRRMS
jgi:ribosomal protein S18 acetylase RimI-like enzyme